MSRGPAAFEGARDPTAPLSTLAAELSGVVCACVWVPCECSVEIASVQEDARNDGLMGSAAAAAAAAASACWRLLRCWRVLRRPGRVILLEAFRQRRWLLVCLARGCVGRLRAPPCCLIDRCRFVDWWVRLGGNCFSEGG